MSEFAKGSNSKKKQKAITCKNEITFFRRFSPVYLLIILYQLSKFEASYCNSF